MDFSERFRIPDYRRRMPKYTACPDCHKLTFAAYVDTEKGLPLPEHLGKCERVDKCGCHNRPFDYFERIGGVKEWERKNDVTDFRPERQDKDKAAKPLKVGKSYGFIPDEIVTRSTHPAHWHTNPLYLWLCDYFGPEIAGTVWGRYRVGTSHTYTPKGGSAWVGSSIFFLIDTKGRTHWGELQQFGRDGHTKRGGRPWEPGGKNKSTLKAAAKATMGCESWYIEHDKETEMHGCLTALFGEHLLAMFPDAKIALVEAPKTALFMACLEPGTIWIATSGRDNFVEKRAEYYAFLKGRTVTLFPDVGKDQKGVSNYQRWAREGAAIGKIVGCTFLVSDILERNTEAGVSDGWDVADLYSSYPPAQILALAKSRWEGPDATPDTPPAQIDPAPDGPAETTPAEAPGLPVDAPDLMSGNTIDLGHGLLLDVVSRGPIESPALTVSPDRPERFAGIAELADAVERIGEVPAEYLPLCLPGYPHKIYNLKAAARSGLVTVKLYNANPFEGYRPDAEAELSTVRRIVAWAEWMGFADQSTRQAA